MKAIVESWETKFNRLVPSIKKSALKLGRFLGVEKAQVEVYLVGNSFMEKNVLAFPAAKDFPRPDVKGKALGEIYLNPDYIRNNDEDLTFMLVHGFLHLLGYDHKKKNDIINMEKKEQLLLKKLFHVKSNRRA